MAGPELDRFTLSQKNTLADHSSQSESGSLQGSRVHFPLRKSEAVESETESDAVRSKEQASSPDEFAPSSDFYRLRVIEGDAKATSYFQNALVLIENEEFSLAKDILGSLANHYSWRPQVIYWLGHCFNKLGNLQEALFCYQRIQDRFEDQYSNFHLADMKYQLGEDESSYQHYLRCLQIANFDGDLAEEMLFEIHKNMGNILMRAGDIEGASENYYKSFRLSPKSDVIEVNLGTTFLKRDEAGEAIHHFRRAVEQNPENDRAWVGLAMVHFMLSDTELAIANLESALECNPANRTAVLLAVDWAQKDGKLREVLPRVTTYLEKEEHDGEIILLHAQILYAMGELTLARFEVERAMAWDPEVRGGAVLLEMIRKSAKESSCQTK